MRICVAVLDDDEMLQDIMAAVLHDFGYHTVVLTSGDGVVEALKQANATAAIVDLHLHSASAQGGLDVLAHLAHDAVLCALPVLICTADARALQRHEAQFAAAGYAVLEKPFELAELLAWLNKRVPLAAPLARQSRICSEGHRSD